MPGIEIDKNLIGKKIDLKKQCFHKQDRGITLQGTIKFIGVVCLENGYVIDPFNGENPFFCLECCYSHNPSTKTVILYDGDNTYVAFDLRITRYATHLFGWKRLHSDKNNDSDTYVSQIHLTYSDKHLLDYAIEEASIDQRTTK